MDKNNGRGRQISDLDKVERLHVLIGAECNNNCIFCMEEDREGRRKRMNTIDPEDVRHMLESNAFRHEVIFTGGEPTLNPVFPAYVRQAGDYGYTLIGVCTNGRRLAYAKYTAMLVRAGLNHFIVSIHGPDAKTHDALTRTRGAFDQAMEGLRTLKGLQQLTPIDIHTSTVVNMRNFRLIKETYTQLSPYVDQMVFNVLQPWGRGHTYFDRLMPRYTDVAAEFAAFLETFTSPSQNTFLLDIPYCTTTAIPDHNRGFNERRVHYDKVPDSRDYWPDSDIRVNNEASLEGGASRKAVLKRDTAQLKGLLFVHHRDDQDQHQRVKRAQCKDCVYEAICDGVWKTYIQKYGWEEFLPVQKKG